jgi:hypothetical protein
MEVVVVTVVSGVNKKRGWFVVVADRKEERRVVSWLLLSGRPMRMVMLPSPANQNEEGERDT